MKTYTVEIATGISENKNKKSYMLVATDEDHAANMAHTLYREEMNVKDGIFTRTVSCEVFGEIAALCE